MDAVATGVEPKNGKAAQSEATRAKLMQAAEKMIAQYGVEGVSLRQIRVAIGSSHTNAITYHFGSKEALIDAIIMDRHPSLERGRAKLLDEARRDGMENDLATLTRAVWFPFFDLTNAEGNHTYFSFLLNIGWHERRKEVAFALETELGELIAARIPKSARNFLDERLDISSRILVGALEYCDKHYGQTTDKARNLFETALRMATAALAAP